jgi:CobQ-like glutamine amidotransferase family enzyme
VELAEVLQVVDGQIVAGEVQQAVDQHRAVAVGLDEAVAVGPLGVGRVVAQVAAPQHFGDFGHAHRGARVAGVGLLDGVHGQRTDRAGQGLKTGGLTLREEDIEGTLGRRSGAQRP